MALGLKRLHPSSGTGLGKLSGHGFILSVPVLERIAEPDSAGQKIRKFVELAIRRCGSAAALARKLGVKPPTVSQWRSGRKHPDAVHLIRIQELANLRLVSCIYGDPQLIRSSAAGAQE